MVVAASSCIDGRTWLYVSSVSWICVTQSLLDDLGVRVSNQQVGSVAMTQIVQADLGKAASADQPSEGVGQHARRPGAAVLAKADLGVVYLPDARANNCSACLIRCQRNSSTTRAGRAINRALPFLGGFSRVP